MPLSPNPHSNQNNGKKQEAEVSPLGLQRSQYYTTLQYKTSNFVHMFYCNVEMEQQKLLKTTMI